MGDPGSARNKSDEMQPVSTEIEPALEMMEAAQVSRLYAEVKDHIWRFLMGLARNEHEAEDLVQATFLRLLEKVEQGVVRRSGARALLFSIAHNLFMDGRRKTKKEVPGAEELAIITPSPERDLSGRIQELIRQVCEDPDVPARQRAVLRLRIYGQYKLQAIADAMGLSRTTVFTDLESVIRRLRDVFSEAGITPEELMR